jgi:hypothetical protein
MILDIWEGLIMKKFIIFIAILCVFTLTLTACGSEGSSTDNSIDNEYKEAENGVSKEETPGIFTEPMTGAEIAYPGILTCKTDYYGQYGKGVTFTDLEGDPTIQLDIIVDEIYADRMDDAYEKLGFSGGMSDAKLMAYTENYVKVFTESEFFDETTYTYDWLCLLTDGSVLRVTLAAEQKDPVLLAQEISIDFNAAEGELGLASIYDLPPDEGSSAVAGIWKNAENGYWFDCSGGLLFSLYDAEGNIVDCGTYDSFFESLLGYDESYSAWVDDSGLNINGVDGVFQREQTLEISPSDIPAGIPCEGTQAREASGELMEYRGEWENDTISCRLEINRGGINIYEGSDYSNDSYTLTDEGDLALSDGTLVRIQDSGGLTMDGYNGVFYRAGEQENAYAPYLGQWYNDVIGQNIWLQDGGVYGYESGESRFAGSIWSVTGKAT